MNIQDFLEVLLPILRSLLCVLLGVVGLRMRALYARYVDTAAKEAAARTAVQATEQVCRALDGPAKLKAAFHSMSELLAREGISVSEEEATLLLESAVAAFKQGWQKNGSAPADTDA